MTTTRTTETPIPNRLRFYRKLHGLTLEEAGARVGCSHTQVADLERGRVQLTVQWMRKFARVYCVAPTDLLVEEDRADNMSDNELGLIRLLRSASTEKRAATIQLIDAVLAA